MCGCDTRAQIRDGTTLGLAAKSYIDKGDLVPDKVIVSIFKLPSDRLYLCVPFFLLVDRLCLTLHTYRKYYYLMFA